MLATLRAARMRRVNAPKPFALGASIMFDGKARHLPNSQQNTNQPPAFATWSSLYFTHGSISRNTMRATKATKLAQSVFMMRLSMNTKNAVSNRRT